MHWALTFLLALPIALFAALGAALIHYNFLWSDSLGIGMGVFMLVGASMLYRMFFWHDEAPSPRFTIARHRCHNASSPSNAFASFRSSVSNPSVNQP